MSSAGEWSELVDAIAGRTDDIVEVLGALRDEALFVPSRLPGWDKLTIVCHLRYGADAFRRMTLGGVTGQQVSYYPEGRDQQRPATLSPAPGERPGDVVVSLDRRSRDLDDVWRRLTPPQWHTEVTEPPDNKDLGPLLLSQLALLRFTEIEAHGTDLDVGLDRWSDLFVALTLPFRVQRLNTRRVEDELSGTWVLAATDGAAYLIAVHDGVVTAHETDCITPADAVIEATSRDLLALLLGRPLVRPLKTTGGPAIVDAFRRAFPGP